MWLVSLLLVLVAAAAQENPQEQRKPGWLLHLVFPNPTGDNGLEDLLIAAEMLDANRAYKRYKERANQDKATLQDKRAAITGCGAVFTRLRVGLARHNLEWPKEPRRPKGRFEELGAFRQLARLLCLEQEVHFADGRERQAIDSFRDGYRLGQVLEQRLLVHGLTGLACQAIAVATLAQRLDQLDHEDCKYLRRVCSDLMDQPSGVESVIRGEMEFALAHLEGLTAKGALDFLSEESGLEEEEPDEDTLALREKIEEDPDFLNREIRRAREMAGAYMNDFLEQARKPILERVIPDADAYNDGSLGWQLIGPSLALWGSVLERFDQAQVRLQVLTVHAAILEYRWWYGVTPADLSKLNLGDIVTDPFTSKPLIYKRLGDYRYKLYSAGPNKTDDNSDYMLDVAVVQGDR